MKPVRIARTVRAHVGCFAMTFKQDHPDCQVGTPFLAKNGRFIITKRTLDPKTGELTIQLQKDPTTRAQRKGQPPQKNILTNAQYDAVIARSKRP